MALGKQCVACCLDLDVTLCLPAGYPCCYANSATYYKHTPTNGHATSPD